ncbi:unnamed protein product [Kuraishia capsulata CBS 1993]|uniref:Calponin-homology (CH) domain-containing protein n=1 Tax=Kuraishia capsulata CBS 1993 TaxID=1382522 RepID=W6MGW9_9ASCO|nr:uncharacterized protein KUCA_T00001103001 [Kuraishia capsulata CBS 1993]CDK25136.1 unnamed protein product [Kuraishia capsulata CBS 1993]
MFGESRTELVAWINQVFGLEYSKVEQCGTGAVYCLIFDSIYQDLPMNKVNFNPTTEYHNVNNFKILQAGFTRHHISRAIPVDRLVKCRLQDNLEFLQWMKKFWTENKDESPYDPVARRNESVTRSSSTMPSLRVLSGSRRSSLANGPSSSMAAPAAATPNGGHLSVLKPRNPSLSNANAGQRIVSSSTLQKEVVSLRNQLGSTNDELENAKDGIFKLEKERDFYFEKLRNIEIICQSITEENEDSSRYTVDSLVKEFQEILYSTEEGFDIPSAEPELPEVKMTDEECF